MLGFALEGAGCQDAAEVAHTRRLLFPRDQALQQLVTPSSWFSERLPLLAFAQSTSMLISNLSSLGTQREHHSLRRLERPGESRVPAGRLVWP